MPELSSLRLNKKLFNNRLQNDPENLKKVISGVTKDISDISNLITSLKKYRSSFNDLKQTLQTKAPVKGAATEDTEGLLGKIPGYTESIAELMLFDSNVKVYEDSNVVMQEFDFRTRANKKIDYKSKKKPIDKARMELIKMKYQNAILHNI